MQCDGDLSGDSSEDDHQGSDEDSEDDRDKDGMSGEEEEEYENGDEYEGEEYEDNDEKGSEDPEKCLDLFLHDMGSGACFRPGTFDGCISVSALQWLCHANRSHENPRARILRLFTTLFGSLARGARAVFQFYPETGSQIDLMLGCAMKAGFTGGLVVDYPNSTRAKKYYLCLMTGPSMELPSALLSAESSHQVGVDKRSNKRQRRRDGKNVSRREWVQKKKDLARKRGKKVKGDSKYTARKRGPKF